MKMIKFIQNKVNQYAVNLLQYMIGTGDGFEMDVFNSSLTPKLGYDNSKLNVLNTDSKKGLSSHGLEVLLK